MGLGWMQDDEACRVAVVAADPLLVRALGAALDTAPGIEVVDEPDGSDGTPVADPTVDVRLVDPDGAPPGDDDGPRAGPPVVVVVDDASAARAWLAAGARGVVSRRTALEAWAPLLQAAARGVSALDPALAQALFPPRGPSDVRNDPPFPDLTRREREVLELVAAGLSNRKIARRLGISEHTAKFHVNAILTKLDADTRTEAVVVAARQGILML